MILVSEEFAVFPKDEKTNITFPFIIDKDTKALKISFGYEPKELTDNIRARTLIENNIKKDAGDYADEYPSWEEFLPLKNLITVSVDDPESYRGCAHRQEKYMEHIIREDFASLGFNKGEIKQGQWKVVLNIHGVVTEKIDCVLKVEAGDFYE